MNLKKYLFVLSLLFLITNIACKANEQENIKWNCVDKIKCQNKPQVEKKTHIDAEALRQQIMKLGAEQFRYKLRDDDTVIPVSAHKFVIENYKEMWSRKVERIGNLNYPEAAAGINYYTLTTEVGIKADGSIHHIRIQKPSGNLVLDEAVKNIVKKSAPFEPLPKVLLKDLQVLVITRKWVFHDSYSEPQFQEEF